MLLLFAVVPTVAVSALWTGTASRALSLMSSGSAWERVARSGEAAIATARSLPLREDQRQALDLHERELRESVEQATRFDYVAARTMRIVIVGALLVVVLVAIGASRVAGHLSRQLSRPLDELVGWTGLIRTGRPVPEQTERPGAPEFEVLRTGMRTMVRELEIGRRRALEAERADAFRESARRFAHELKNPLSNGCGAARRTNCAKRWRCWPKNRHASTQWRAVSRSSAACPTVRPPRSTSPNWSRARCATRFPSTSRSRSTSRPTCRS
jgi:hypothetical protein